MLIHWKSTEESSFTLSAPCLKFNCLAYLLIFNIAILPKKATEEANYGVTNNRCAASSTARGKPAAHAAALSSAGLVKRVQPPPRRTPAPPCLHVHTRQARNAAELPLPQLLTKMCL